MSARSRSLVSVSTPALKSLNSDITFLVQLCPDSKVHGANMGSTWVLWAPDGPHVGPMNLAIRVCLKPFT